MKKHVVLSLFAAVTALSGSAFAGHQQDEILPPPPPIQPYPDETAVMSCNVYQYTLQCSNDSFGNRTCQVSNKIDTEPVKVDFRNYEDGTLRIRTTVRGQEQLIYQSRGPMNCDLSKYVCLSANQNEKLSVVTTPSRQYATDEFTLWEQRPANRYLFIVGATAKIECKAATDAQ